MDTSWIKRWGWLLPALSLGLFVGRVWSEWAPGSPWLITLLACMLSGMGLRRLPLRHSWPALLLLWYTLATEPAPNHILSAGGLAALTVLLQSQWPHSRSRSPQAIGAAISLLFFALYWVTLAPGSLPADSGEFQLVAVRLGVAHPPGFPQFTRLQHVEICTRG